METRILESTILKRGYGTVNELLEEVSKDDLRHLQLGGYIQNGISDEGETFCLTKKGKDMLYFYSGDVSMKHKIQSWILHYLFRFNVAI